MKNYAVVLCLVVCMFTGCGAKEEKKSVKVSNQPDKALISKQLLQQGVLALNNGDVASAIKSFQAAAEVTPDEFQPVYLQVETLIKLKQFEQAATVLEKATKNFPDNPAVYYLLSVSNAALDRKLPAALAARRSAELFKDNGDEENLLKSVALLNSLVESAKQEELSKEQ